MKRWNLRRRRSPQASWRAVPEMNLLEGRSPGRRWVVRAGLAILLLGGVYLLYSVYQEGATLQRETDGASSSLRAVQGELASRRDEVDRQEAEMNRLEAELGALQERRRAAERLPQQPGSERWRAALAALDGLQGDGMQFQSLKGSAGGELTVVAVAAGVQPLARLQEQLHEAGQPFELQGVLWEQTKEALTFTATLRVRASP